MLEADRNEIVGTYCALRKALLKNGGKAVGFDYETRESIIDNFKEHIDNFNGGKFTFLNKYQRINQILASLDVYSSFAIGSSVHSFLNDYKMFPNKKCLKSDCFGTLKAPPISKLSQYSLNLTESSTAHCLLEENARTGLEIPGDKLYFKRKHDIKVSAGGSESQFANEIICHISNGMLLDESASVELICQKLNVYSEESPFQQSPDSSTHDPTTFIGTVLVCLPSVYTGGDVTVRHGQDQFVYSFAEKSGNKDRIQFVAFFGDCEYDIAPITSGHSVILNYSIIQRHKDKSLYTKQRDFDPHNRRYIRSLPRLEEDYLENRLQKIFDTASKAMHDKCFGVFLSQDYTACGLTPENLTDLDKYIYEFMLSKNIPVSLEPALLCLNYYDVVDTVDDVHQDVLEYDFSVSKFAVCLIGAFEDTRHEEHKNIPYKKLPIFNAWGKFTENVNDDKETVMCVPPLYRRAGDPAIVHHDRLDLCYVMILGPFPAASHNTTTVAAKNECIEYSKHRDSEEEALEASEWV